MTTDNIVLEDDGEEYGVDELIVELGRLGAAAKQRAQRVQSEKEQVGKKRSNTRIGARVIERGLLDHEQKLDEEKDQLHWILSITGQEEDEEPEPPEIPGFVQQPPPEEPPAPPAPPTPPASPPPVPPTQPVTQMIPVYLHPGNWTWLQWVLAVLLALAGLWVGGNTYDFFDFEGVGRTVCVVLWVSLTTLFGFFLGGLVGYGVETWWNNRGNNPVAPAPQGP
jgi:hypothetical protein